MVLYVYVAHIKMVESGKIVSDLQAVFSTEELAEQWWLEKSTFLVALGFTRVLGSLSIGGCKEFLRLNEHLSVRFGVAKEMVI